MTEPAAGSNGERPSLVEAFDWRAGRTWALFAGASVGFGGVLALVCVALEGFVYLLFATEPPEGRAFVTLMLGACLAIGAAAILERYRIPTPGTATSDPDLRPHRDRYDWPRNLLDAVLHLLWPLASLASAWVASGILILPFTDDFFSGVSLYPALLLALVSIDVPFWVIDRWTQN